MPDARLADLRTLVAEAPAAGGLRPRAVALRSILTQLDDHSHSTR